MTSFMTSDSSKDENKSGCADGLQDNLGYTHIPYIQRKEIISHDHFRYKKIVPEYQQRIGANDRAFTNELYDFFCSLYTSGEILLGDEVGIRDEERAPIDTIVLHHTKHSPGLTKDMLSAIELIRLYAPYYANPSQEDGNKAMNKPISSGHVRAGKQVFRPYHRLIRADGTAERLLGDEEIGWHAGSRQVNCRSIAIAIDDDLSEKEPTEVQLRCIADLVRTYYSTVPLERIYGHHEINTKTDCPGTLFLGTKQDGWKYKLLKLLFE